MVSLDNYTGIIQIDKTNQLVTVRGGTTLKEIVISLEDVGLSLPQLPSVSAQTISGAIATGTHGTGIKYGNMATLVAEIEIISAQGIVRI
jgi:L-gulonolactone oxidase